MRIESLLQTAGLPRASAPIGGERIAEQLRKERAELEAWLGEREAGEAAEPEAAESIDAQPPSPGDPQPPPAAPPAPWGTPEARRAEIERLRRRMEENAAKRERGVDDQP
jgi:hypothetical protein